MVQQHHAPSQTPTQLGSDMLKGTGVRPERKLPFYDHIPLRWAMSLSTHGLVVEAVGLWLFSRMRQCHAQIRAQRSTWIRVLPSDIADGVGVDPRHVREAIGVLEKYGFLIQEATRKGNKHDPRWTLMLDFPYDHVRYFTEGINIPMYGLSSGYEIFARVSIEEHNIAMAAGKSVSIMHWALILNQISVNAFRLATAGIPRRTQYNGLSNLYKVMPKYSFKNAKLPRVVYSGATIQRYATVSPGLGS